MFGRGGEEIEALHEHGIPFEVVPGVTSAIAVPAYAGITLTHRRLASYFTVVTGTQAPDKDIDSIAWETLARDGGTLVVLMGWENLPGQVKKLVEYGRSPDTPVALVQWGTEPWQKTVVGTLSDIVERAADAGFSSPVVAVIGEVVGLREKLRWYDNRPLFGKRVLVTRTRAQAGVLSELLFERGAHAIELPVIEVQPSDDYDQLDGAIRRLATYDWAIFTSENAVQAVFDRLDALGLDTRAFGGVQVGAIGPSTATSLRSHGIVADFVPDDFVSKAIVDGLKHQDLRGRSVLLPRADIAPEGLVQGLSSLGAAVEEVTAYRTVTPADSSALVGRILSEGIDIATFTSASTVRNLAHILQGDLKRVAGATIACIGPITAAAAGDLGLRVDIVAPEHTVCGLVDALETYFAKEGRL